MEEAVPLTKVVLDAASLHQQRQVLRLELSLQLGFEPEVELGWKCEEGAWENLSHLPS